MIQKINEAIDAECVKMNQEERADRPKNQEYFYASNAGGCPRNIYFSFKGAEGKPMDAKLLRIFANGNAVHERVTKYLKRAGLLVDEEINIPRDELNIHGRYDGRIMVAGEEAILEIKSINSRNVKAPMEHHIDQLQIYLHYVGLKKGVLLYESKQTQQIFCFEIPYDEERVNKVLDWFKWLKEKIDTDSLPEVPKKYKWNSYPCNWCDRKEHCQFLATGVGKPE